jgi:RHS repeat-associated protein
VVTDDLGNNIQDITYYPFGQAYNNSGNVDVRYKFTGKELDNSTDLYFYEARYYDAHLARFISADTIVPGPFDPQALNRYSYVRNNPLIYTDPSGNFFEEIAEFSQEVINFVENIFAGENDIEGPVEMGGDGSLTQQTSATMGKKVSLEATLEVQSIIDLFDKLEASHPEADDSPRFEHTFSKQFGQGCHCGTLLEVSSDAVLYTPTNPFSIGKGLTSFVILGTIKKTTSKKLTSEIVKKSKGIETRGYKPAPGERTFQGQVESARKQLGGNPTVQRGSPTRDLVRLRSKGHGFPGASATPQNARNLSPDGKNWPGSGKNRAITKRDIRELHKGLTGHGTSTVRTLKGRGR